MYNKTQITGVKGHLYKYDEYVLKQNHKIMKLLLNCNKQNPKCLPFSA